MKIIRTEKVNDYVSVQVIIEEKTFEYWRFDAYSWYVWKGKTLFPCRRNEERKELEETYQQYVSDQFTLLATTIIDDNPTLRRFKKCLIKNNKEEQKMICPYCNKNTEDKHPRELAKKLAKKNGMISERITSDGRELEFPFGRIYLIDDCNWCDYEKLKKEIDQLTLLHWIKIAGQPSSLDAEISKDWEAWVARPCVKTMLAPRQARAALEILGYFANRGVNIEYILNLLIKLPRINRLIGR